jgi:hypothetical protein
MQDIQYAVLSTSSSLQIDVTLNSVFASRKRDMFEEEKGNQVAAVLPSNFQVYAKIDEESRKDNRLAASFLVTLNDVKGTVTYEFRGVCSAIGSSADFEAIMGTNKDSRVPKVLDILYQRLYPAIFILAGMTTASYPQSVGLLTEMVSSEPIQVHQEAEAVPKLEEKPKLEQKPQVLNKTAPAEVPKPTVAKVKKQPGTEGDIGSRATVAK